MSKSNKLRSLKAQLLGQISQAWVHYPPICDNVGDWCQKQPQHIAELLERLLETQIVYRSLPNTIDDHLNPIFQKYARYTAPAKYLTRIANAKLFGRNGIIVLPDGSYTAEPMMNKRFLAQTRDYTNRFKQNLTTTVRKSGQYYSLLQVSSFGNNYYHWLHDIAQKLYLIIEHLPKEVRVIVPDDLQDWQFKLLEIVGVTPDRLVLYSGREIWQIEHLYFSPPTTASGYDLAEPNQWIQQRFYQEFNVDPGRCARNKLIYISRDRARGRRITNAKEVEVLLQDFGFETYYLEHLSLAEQVHLFANAKAVVSPHGAGLTNVMFAPPGTCVLEIVEPSLTWWLFYWSLCDALQHQYWYLTGATIDNPTCLEQANIQVPLDKLKRFLVQCST